MSYYFTIILLLGTVYMLGLFVAVLIITGPGKIHEQFLTKIITGTVLLVLLYSVFKTNGYTVNLILIIPLAFLLFTQSKRSEGYLRVPQRIIQSFKQDAFLLLLLGLYATVWFAWQYSLYHANVTGSILYAPYGDAIYYSDIANSLKDYGAENIETIRNRLFDVKDIRLPYHYFELWITAFVSDITGLTSVEAFLVIVPVFLYSLLSLLLFLLASHFGIKKQFAVFTPLLLFVKCFVVIYPFTGELISANFLSYVSNFDYSYISLPKFLIYLFFILAAIFFYYKESTSFVYVLMFLPIVSFTSIPSVLGLLGIVIVIDFIKNRIMTRALGFFLPGAAIMIFLYLFYRNNLSSNEQYDVSVSVAASSLRTYINIFGGTFLQVVYLYLPFFIFIILFVILFKKRDLILSKKTLLLATYFIIAFLSGLTAWAAINQKINSHQFFSNFFISGINALIMVLLIQLLSGIGLRPVILRVAFIVCLGAFLLYSAQWNYRNHVELVKGRQPVSKSFYENVSMLLKQNHSNYLGGAIFSHEDYKNTPVIRYSFVHWPGQFLKLENNDFYVVTLSGIDTANSGKDRYENDRNLDLAKRSVFYYWIKNHEKEKNLSKQSIESLQIDFIREKNIKFLVLSKSAILPEGLKVAVQKELTDTLTGIRFILLNKI